MPRTEASFDTESHFVQSALSARQDEVRHEVSRVSKTDGSVGKLGRHLLLSSIPPSAGMCDLQYLMKTL